MIEHILILALLVIGSGSSNITAPSILFPSEEACLNAGKKAEEKFTQTWQGSAWVLVQVSSLCVPRYVIP